MTSDKIKTVTRFVVLAFLVIAASYTVTSVWIQKKEHIPEKRQLIFEESMTVDEFGRKNDLPNHVLQKTFDLKSKENLKKSVGEFDFTPESIAAKVDKVKAIEAEHESKNWRKIFAKFILWFAVLGTAFYLLRRGKVTPGIRKIVYLTSLTVFGIVLGSDPSAMGTIKDAIVLFAAKRVVFPPRMIALTVFLLLVFLANKFFCSWGCQLGTLQDLIFRLNRDKKDRKGIFRQYKPPFIVTNSIRIAFLVVFTVIAFAWTLDIVETIDPFKVFKPAKIGVYGWFFTGGILIASLFIYRPWCSIFCPFGLVGWFVEKASLFKIKVNYDTCETCATGCPSTAMETILKRERTVTDCFACGTCINECPTGSITFEFGRRQDPPVDKFTKNADK
ncbi:MAG: 4Fe-4S binding protein [Proteobacteria bacterium]|nr:4Fe-4S binding protein [Pseudomonadota bacterium]